MSVYPDSVHPGDTVGLAMPSSMIDQATLDKVVVAAKKLGLKCKIGQNMQRVVNLFTAQQNGAIDQLYPTLDQKVQHEYDQYIASGYAGGDPIGRANDINNFFADSDVAAIWCLRGGYSSSMILPYLDYDLIRHNPRQILGYSDVTNVITAINRKANLVTYHAPMLTPNFVRDDLLDDGQPDAFSFRYFQEFIMSDWSSVELKNPDGVPLTALSAGSADGTVVGGNLSELVEQMGTPYAFETAGRIVFLEEVRTHVLFCDLALTQLENAGFFDNVAGVVLGDFLECHNWAGYQKCQDWTADKVLARHFADKPFPVLSGLKFGHDKQTVTIPIGARCHLDATNQRITILR